MSKKLLFFLFVFSFAAGSTLHAQCSFTPEITPSNLILCPNSSDTLFTTESYDAYQWYKNGTAIPGATLPYLVVKNPGDVLKRFSVIATRNGCSQASAKVLVDGYVFLLPYTISTGDEGTFDPQTGAFINCPGDVHLLQVSPGYETNVQWYNSGRAIPGANDPTLTLTKGIGSYTFMASPNACPNVIENQPIPFDIGFKKRVEISAKNDTLFASQKNGEFRWLLDNQVIPHTNQNYFVPTQTGSYRVGVKDKYCTNVSAPFVVNAVAKKMAIENFISFAPNPVQDVLHVQLKSPEAARMVISDITGNRIFDIALTGQVMNIPVQKLHTGSYVLQVMNKGGQLLGSGQLFKQ